MIFTATGSEMSCVAAFHDAVRSSDLSGILRANANQAFECLVGAFGLSRRGSESSNEISVTLEINEGPEYDFNLSVAAYEPP